MAEALHTAQIGNQLIHVFPNKKYAAEDGKKKGCFTRFLDYAKEASGVFRLFQVGQRVCSAAVEILKKFGSSMSEFFKKLGAKFMLAWTILTIPRVPIVMKDFVEACKKLKNKPQPGEHPGTQARRRMEAVKHGFDAGAAVLYSANVVTGNPTIKVVADGLDLVNNVADCQLNAQTLANANKTLAKAKVEKVDGQVQEALKKTAKHAFLKTMKAVCSIAGGVLGLAMIAFGWPVLPALLLIGVSLASTVFAMWSTLYENGSRTEMVDFYKTKYVQLLPA